MVHKKIMERCSKALVKDAEKYARHAKKDTGIKRKHDKIEMAEAAGAAKDLKRRAKKAHEY